VGLLRRVGEFVAGGEKKQKVGEKPSLHIVKCQVFIVTS
jgi:hypothetical protein